MENPWDQSPLKVSQVTALIKETLETGFPNLFVEGEISNCRPSSTGHLYFSLKDKDSLLSCVMFRMQLRSLSFKPKDGDLVRVRGSLSVYMPRGTYQLVVRSMEPVGTGRILAMLEERKRRLQAEGLFDRRRKLPPYPRKVGVITSPTGAALRDVLRIFHRLNPPIDIQIFPASVQGLPAEKEISRQIRKANQLKDTDLLILTRGGGSLEDLLAFSSEEVVRTVADSEIPIISAVGHEIDWALSDFAADQRAATPSAAAEIISSPWVQFQDRRKKAREEMVYFMKNKLERARDLNRLFSPEIILQSFQHFLQPFYFKLDEAKGKLNQVMETYLANLRNRLDSTKREMEAMDPQGILKRGYAMIWDEQSQVLTRAAEAKKFNKMKIQFQDVSIQVLREEGNEQ